MTEPAYGYAIDVPPYVHTPCLPDIPDVDALIAYWASSGIRPIRVGADVTLGYRIDGAGIGFRAPDGPDAYLVERWAPLLAARLEGGRVACAVTDCQHDATVMLVGRVAVCPGHAAAPAGTEVEQPTAQRKRAARG